ncbi:unnamed protein product [marine sediment metagenome]|uniref:NTF2-like N-terminal transpeptidase domain-containing protein n=1 Tax=marine sediment metagenome TaxID=412755 RepID=X1TJ67_9ZZZZ
MKKLALLILVVVLLLGLIGCEAFTPISEEEKAESVVYDYFEAFNELDWDKAKSCCVIGSDMYNDTLQTQTYFESVEVAFSLNMIVNITSTSVNGNYAEVNFYLTVTMVLEGTESEFTKDDITCYLQKVGNNWKIYDSENLEYEESDT